MKREHLWLAAVAGLGWVVVLWTVLRLPSSESQLESVVADSRQRELIPPTAPSVALDAGIVEANNERAPASRETVAPATAAPVSEIRFPFRGRVLDVANDQPVAAALAVCGALEAITDSDGRFTSDSLLPADFEELEFHSVGRASHIRTAARSDLEWVDEERGWIARIRIGPTFRFRVVGAAAAASSRWRGRIVDERRPESDESWAWIDAVPDDPPWIRYDNPLAHRNKSRSRLEVESFEGTLRGSVEVSTTIGIHPGVLLVQVDRELAGIRGRVVDENDQPRSRVTVLAAPRRSGISNAEAWLSATTDEEGRYVLRALTPGPYWIQASPRRGEDPRTIEFDASAGENTAPDIVLPAERLVGAIEGLLKSTEETYPPAVVRLRAVDGRVYEHFDVVDPKQQSNVARKHRELLRDPRVTSEPVGFFEFQQVPEGEYEITVMSDDGRRWTPTPLHVRPPMKDLEIFRDDATKTWQPQFDVRDATTGEPIDDRMLVESLIAKNGTLEAVSAQFVLDECWRRDSYPCAMFLNRVAEPRFVEGTRLRWTVFGGGYGIASGTDADFAGTGDVRTVRVTLSRGYGARLVMRDARGRFRVLRPDWTSRFAASEHPPISGVQVFADGELAATSDERGFATLALERKPARIELRAPGWVVLGSNEFRDGELELGTREAIVWLTRP